MRMENKELENAINELMRLKKILLVQCKEDVKNIIENKVTEAILQGSNVVGTEAAETGSGIVIEGETV